MVLYDWNSTWTGGCRRYWMHVVLEQLGVRFGGEDENVIHERDVDFRKQKSI